MLVVHQIQGKTKTPPTAWFPMQFFTEVLDFIPPVGYEMLFEYQLSDQSGQYVTLQSYSTDNSILFTTTKTGTFSLRVNGKISVQRVSQPDNVYQLVDPSLKIQSNLSIITSTLELIVVASGAQKPPCCIPLQQITSPVYRIPTVNITPAPLVRIVVMPDMPKQHTGFTPPSDAPGATDLDWKNPAKSLRGWHPPLRQVIFTPWIQSVANEEMFIPTVGMIPNKIYAVKHQFLDGKKKLELKSKLNYQAEQLNTSFSVIPIFASEPKDRPYYVIADNFQVQDAISNGKVENKLLQTSESAVLTSYGDCLINLQNSFDPKDQYQNEYFQRQHKKRIVTCNGQQLITIGSGVCSFCHPGISFQKGREVKQLCDDVASKLDMNAVTQTLLLDQVVSVCTINGVPLRTISVGYVNDQLYLQYKQLLAAADGANPPKFRPLVNITTFTALENGWQVIAGQAEVQLKDHPKISEQAAQRLTELKLKQSADSIGMLTAVVVVLNQTGALQHTFYACDVFATELTAFEFVTLQQPGQKITVNTPSYISNGLALTHSVVGSMDCSQRDVIFCLPRQNAIVRLDLTNFKADQPQTSECALEQSYSDIVVYEQKPRSSVARYVQSVIGGDLVPLALTRISSRLYIVVNNTAANCVEVISVSIPQFIAHGVKDVQDVLLETDTDQTESEQVSEPKTTTTDEQISDEIKVKQRTVLFNNTQAVSACIVGLLKGGFAAGIKLQKDWKIVEVQYDTVMYAATIQCNGLNLIRVF